MSKTATADRLPNPDAPHHLFVYGTLRDRDNAVTATLHGADKDDTGRYPTIYPDEGSTVTGDVFPVTDENELAELDTYEGVPVLYKRLETANGIELYVGHPSHLWCQHADYQFDEAAMESWVSDLTVVIDG